MNPPDVGLAYWHRNGGDVTCDDCGSTLRNHYWRLGSGPSPASWQILCKTCVDKHGIPLTHSIVVELCDYDGIIYNRTAYDAYRRQFPDNLRVISGAPDNAKS